MITITKPGRKDYGVQEYVCYVCECEFEATYLSYTIGWEWRIGGHTTCKCPECGAPIDTPIELERDD